MVWIVNSVRDLFELAPYLHDLNALLEYELSTLTYGQKPGSRRMTSWFLVGARWMLVGARWRWYTAGRF